MLSARNRNEIPIAMPIIHGANFESPACKRTQPKSATSVHNVTAGSENSSVLWFGARVSSPNARAAATAQMRAQPSASPSR